MRILNYEIFLGSTIEEVSVKFKNFLKTKSICPGNYIETKLYKLGSVYQLTFAYAELILKTKERSSNV